MNAIPKNGQPNEHPLLAQYNQEQREWAEFVKKRLGPDADLFWISGYCGNWRNYRKANVMAKIRRIRGEPYGKAQDLKGEYVLLSRFQTRLGLMDVEYYEEDGWQLISRKFIDGEPLERVYREKSLWEKTAILLGVLRLLLHVNLHGVAYRDLRLDHVIVEKDGRIHLVDFDQAIETRPLFAFCIDILGRKVRGLHGYGSFIVLCEHVYSPHRTITTLFRGLHYLRRRLIRPIKRAFAKALGREMGRGRSVSPPEVLLKVPSGFNQLALAWEKAASSGANSPGCRIAYYSFTLGDCHFFGERPWQLRWERVSQCVSFKGKKVLELGCNLGLFSAFARSAGASHCTGVDHNAEVLEGARLLAEALGVHAEYRQVDFDSPQIWEDQLAGFDLVISLSVFNWLKDQERFLKFLGRHNELLYEGHDAPEVEVERLKRVGFGRIEHICVSERQRTVFYAAKLRTE